MDNPWYKALCVIQDEINHSTFKFFKENSIRSMCLPITTGSVTSPMGLGSDSLPVKVNLEGVETYLSDSMQFHLEYGLRLFDKGVHYIMPSFRGELADARHLCQFYHSEAEIKGNLEDVIKLVNKYIHRLCEDLLNNVPQLIESITGDIEHIKTIVNKNGEYPRITFEEAIELLGNNSKYFKHHEQGFRTITDAGEKELIKKYGGIVWLTHHDYLSVPFYQDADERGVYALNGDLLFGIGEVVGSGERHTTGDEVREALHYHNVPETHYEWYLNMKDNFPLKTAGFGMGVERFILWLLKHDDIRDCQLIPRFNGVLINP
ncbi:asparaginase [Bacillus sp. Leaf75]|nr:asparaginase [Bacillus sp. Leaf75]